LIASREIRIDSFEQLRAATPTSNAEIIQIEAGRMQGRLKHATVAGLSLGFGTFSRGHHLERRLQRGTRDNRPFCLKVEPVDLDRSETFAFGPQAWSTNADTLVVSLSAHSRCRSTTWRVSLDPDSRFSEPWHGRRPFGFVRIAKRERLPRTDFGRSWRALRVGPWRISERQAEYWKRAILDTAATGD
jgi:AraC family ethanolamine operon transcriptional activator